MEMEGGEAAESRGRGQGAAEGDCRAGERDGGAAALGDA